MSIRSLSLAVALVLMVGCLDDKVSYSASSTPEPSVDASAVNDTSEPDSSPTDVDEEDPNPDTGTTDVPVVQDASPADVQTDAPDPVDVSDPPDTTPEDVMEEDAPTDADNTDVEDVSEDIVEDAAEDIADVPPLEDVPVEPDTGDVGEPDVGPMLPDNCLGVGNPDPDLPYDYFAFLVRIQNIKPVGMVCGESLVWSLTDNEGAPLAADPPCVIETDCGPLREDHPDYAARFEETCAIALPDLENTTLEVLSMSTSTVHDRSMVLCADTCNSPVDCNVGEDCVEGFCRSSGQPDPNNVCQTAGLGQCRAFSPQTDALTPVPERLSLCSRACEDGCGLGECLGQSCSLGLEDGACQGDEACSGEQTCRTIQVRFEDFNHCEGPQIAREPLRAEWRGIAPDAPVRVAVVMDNSGSLLGRGLDEADRAIQIPRATDPDLFRQRGLIDALESLQSREYGARTEVALWQFAGAGRGDVTLNTGTAEAPFISVEAAAEIATNARPNPVAARSNVFDAVGVAAQALASTPEQSHRVLILFTDGPDDSITASPGELAQARAREEMLRQRAADDLAAAGATLYVIHLDAGFDARGLNALKPDDLTPTPRPRDAAGRIGPLAEFEALACATGGVYNYVQDNHAIPVVFDKIERVLIGRWSARLGPFGVASPSFLNMHLRVEAAPYDEEYQFTPGGDFDERQPSDNRPLLFP